MDKSKMENQKTEKGKTEIPKHELTNPYLIAGNTHGFYISYAWKKKRREVLTLDKNECQHCKDRGKYTRATEIHHIIKIDARPDLALDVFVRDIDGNKYRQLISLCKDCHKRLHDDEMVKPEPLTPERW